MKEVNAKETAVEREQRTQKRWSEQKVFQQSVENRKDKPSFVFYEGPPTANGLPHVGHALGRTIKDVVARYKTMSGYHVLRKAGWDTHGLPVELGVEKQLGISGKHEIEGYGVEAFIQKCKESVFTYEKQWRSFTEKIGYWVDMDDPYVTLDHSYIESVWHVLGTIHEKGLLYKGHRVSPYCPSCQTSLSSHEVAQGYKDVKDLTATVKFKRTDRDGEFFLGWTTTPWTLPANVALAVHPEITYVRVQQQGETYVVAKSLVNEVLKGDFTLLSEHKGNEFVGMAYEPPFQTVPVSNGHKVLTADYVTEASGTGVVHIAPAYGEDDYRVIKEHGFSFVNVVDEKGHYTSDVPMFEGRFVKDCDVDVVRYLADQGLLYHKEKYEHSYPFCWRCDSPLLYYATESWFIQMTAIKDQLIENNNDVTWHPDHIKHGRFGNFLDNIVDWNISRKRYWGTPLNVWECEQCNHHLAPKSMKELQRYATSTVEDDVELHKPYVDKIDLTCPSCQGNMKRTSEVIDVWFDSGAMPFAQYHYPFENSDQFQNQFPADVVAEGIDQTRGWFYSLLAVSTLFTGKAPYKRVLSLGHVLDENGQKMSKSKGNALDPLELVDTFGADALRWALLADSAPWNPKKFSKRVVQEAKSKVIDTLMNVYSFYVLYAKLDGYDPAQHQHTKRTKLDEWILSRLHSTLQNVTHGLENYEFTGAAREIAAFIEELSNWYVRRSRERFWAKDMTTEKAAAYATLREVLLTLSKMMAPFAPFMTDEVHENLTGESVHVADYPTLNDKLVNVKLEEEMSAVLQVVELGRSIRNNHSLKVKQPLQALTIVTDADVPWENYEDVIKEELNIKQIKVSSPQENLLTYEVKLDFKSAGPKFGKLVNEVNRWLTSQTDTVAKELLEREQLEVLLHDQILHLTKEDVIISQVAPNGMAVAATNELTVLLTITLTDELVHEGMVREVVRAVQDQRKKLDLPVNLRIDLTLGVTDEMKNILSQFDYVLKENLLLKNLMLTDLKTEPTLTVNQQAVSIHINDN
ncbi:isoleucine--tRNA ligase [Priestia koreensis]|uniref:isoleucine--tRNA ligase n=1 Tax=Priestia koreensis TaxID=284581 RepID=UPI00204191C0|nr:isoleucine--tRNA ligase [Priestia koreensis]MCM3004497.1 isoleucine--tRNA ligase [Priestia koreensis]